MKPADGCGIIYTQDGRTELNIFRSRLDLAHIEGKIYDFLFANRSLSADQSERKRRICCLLAMLNHWHARLPMAFRVENASATLLELELVEVAKLHHAHLFALVQIHGIYGDVFKWLGKAGSLNSVAMQDLLTAMECPTRHWSTRSASSPVLGWDQCLELSRGCMKLFQDVTLTEEVMW